MGNKKSRNQEILSTCLDELASSLKPLNSPKHLVEIGVFKSEKTAANMRCNGTGPNYIKAKGMGPVYPRAAVIDWLSDKAVLRGGQAA